MRYGDRLTDRLGESPLSPLPDLVKVPNAYGLGIELGFDLAVLEHLRAARGADEPGVRARPRLESDQGRWPGRFGLPNRPVVPEEAVRRFIEKVENPLQSAKLKENDDAQPDRGDV